MAKGSEVLSATASGAASGMSFGWPGAIVGGGIGLLGSLFSKQKAAPTIPFTPTNLSEEQQKALQANLAAEPGIEELIGQSNAFQQKQASGLLESAIPGWAKLQKSLTDLATKDAQNPYDVPADVQKNLGRIAAERGISAGTRGQFNDFSLLRDLGVNSLQYGQSRIQQAQGLAQTLAQLAPRVNPMSPLSFYVTPGQQAQVTQGNNAGQLSQDQGGVNAETAAGNFNRTNLWQNISNGILAGGMLGGGTTDPSGKPKSKTLGQPDASGNTMSPYVVNG